MAHRLGRQLARAAFESARLHDAAFRGQREAAVAEGVVEVDEREARAGEDDRLSVIGGLCERRHDAVRAKGTAFEDEGRASPAEPTLEATQHVRQRRIG
jgi:LmbE family N-acetylglucosaminyl deacetylase